MQTVLVVDDDGSVRDLIEVILTMEGFTVYTAASAEEALEITRRVPVDLVTIDLMMPGVSGWELSHRLREEPASAHTRQMIVSAAAMTEELEGAPLIADAVLAKPFDFATFTTTLRGLMNRPPARRLEPHADLLERILRDRLITPAFQPIVDLDTGEVVGVEGLARGPAGPLNLPGPLFDVAHRLGRLHELDALCRLRAISTALKAAADAPPLVFVNVEPGSAELPMNDELRTLLESDLPFQVVVEFTERALTRRLPALIRHAAEIRARGNIVALDDLGVDPRAVALLPLLQPEIIKLDMSLLHSELDHTGATTAVAVGTYAQRSGAKIVAEGIETEAHLATAVALGADWGQGFFFGRPAPMTETRLLRVAATRPSTTSPSAPEGHEASPFALASQVRTPRRGTAALTTAITQRLQAQATALGNLGIFLVVEDSRLLKQSAQPGFSELALTVAFMGILGPGVPPEPMPGAYGVHLDGDDPLAAERVMVVLGPHESTVLVARNLRDSPAPEGGEFEFILSHDRALTEQIARILTLRFTPRDTASRTTALTTVSTG